MVTHIKSKYFWLQAAMVTIILAVFIITISVGNQAMKSARQESILSDTDSRIAGVDTVKHVALALAQFDRLKQSLDKSRRSAQAQLDQMEARNKKGASYFTWHAYYMRQIAALDSVENAERDKLTALRQVEVKRLETQGYSRSSLLEVNTGFMQKYPGMAFSFFAVVLTGLSFIPGVNKENRRVLLGAALLAEGVSSGIFNKHFFGFYFVSSPTTVYLLTVAMTVCVVLSYYWSFVGFINLALQKEKNKDLEEAVQSAKVMLQEQPATVQPVSEKSEFDIPQDPDKAIAWLFRMKASGEYDRAVGKGVPIMQLVALRLGCSRQNIHKRLKSLEKRSNGHMVYSRLSTG